MSLKLAVAADLHYQKTANWKHPERKGEYAYFFLHRFVKMLMITGWPDAVLIGGDLIDPAGACDHAAFGRLQEIPNACRRSWNVSIGRVGIFREIWWHSSMFRCCRPVLTVLTTM